MKKGKPEIVPILVVLCVVMVIVVSFTFSFCMLCRICAKCSFPETKDAKIEIAEPIKKKRKTSVLLCTFVSVLITFAILLSFGIVRISGHSMQPTLNPSDLAFYQRIITSVDLGDVIVFERDDQHYIKRVFGCPGDSIRITENGNVLVNGKPAIVENLVVLGNTSPGLAFDELVMGEKQYFVLGDNRSVSSDSRYNEIGLVSQSEILGIYCFAITTQ